MSNIQQNGPVESVSAFEAPKAGLNGFGSDSTLRLTSHVGTVGKKLSELHVLRCRHQAPTSQSFLAHKFLLGILFATNIIHSPILYPYTVTIWVGTVRFIVVPVSSHYCRQGLSRSPFVDALYQLICQASPEASIGK